MRAELPSGTVTFLFTDIEALHAAAAWLGPEAYAEALAEHRRALRAAFAVHGGVEVDTQGDAFFVAFPTAPGAVAAAEAGQEALEPGPIRVRMGLHTGTPTLDCRGIRRRRRPPRSPGCRACTRRPGRPLAGDGRAPRRGRARRPRPAPPQGLRRRNAAPPARTGRVSGAPDTRKRRAPHPGDTVPRSGTGAVRRGGGRTGARPARPHDRRPGRHREDALRDRARPTAGGRRGRRHLFVPLAPVRDPALVLAALAEAIGADGSQPDQIASRIGARRTHVVIDNVEQLLPAARRIAVGGSDGGALAAAPRDEPRGAPHRRRDAVRSPSTGRDGGRRALRRPRARRPARADGIGGRRRALRPPRPPAARDRARRGTDEAAVARGAARTARRTARPPGAARCGPATCHASRDDRLVVRPARRRGAAPLREPQRVRRRLQPRVGRGDLRRRPRHARRRCSTRASSDDEPGRTDADRYWMLETIREYATGKLAETGREGYVRGRQSNWLRGLAERAGFGAVVEWTRPWRPELVIPELDNVRAGARLGARERPGTRVSSSRPLSRSSGSSASRRRARRGWNSCSRLHPTHRPSYAPRH